MAATQVKSGIAPKRLYSIVHAVNLRTRIDLPFLEHSFGNICRIAMTIPSLDIDYRGGVLWHSETGERPSEESRQKLHWKIAGRQCALFIKQTSENFFE